jgi:hypothetical protein
MPSLIVVGNGCGVGSSEIEWCGKIATGQMIEKWKEECGNES